MQPTRHFQILISALLGSCLAFPAIALASSGNPLARQSSPAPLSFNQTLEEAEKLVASGNPDKAYALLAPLEIEHAGEERFDYLLGIAALDSGQPDKATFALERVLIVNPNSAAARLDIARAYFKLGDMPRARIAFSQVLQMNPPPQARANIEKYLDEIALQEGNGLTRYSGYLEMGAGSDSNVNNASSLNQVYVDALSSTATLDPTNLKTADSYAAMTAGGEVTHRFNPHWYAFAGADARKRNYLSQTAFNSLALDGRAGLGYDRENQHLRIACTNGQLNLDSAINNKSNGLQAEWRTEPSPANQLRLFAQAAQYRFQNAAMQQNDYDQQVAGGGWMHVFPSGQASLSTSFYHGQEQDVSTLSNPPATPSGGRPDGPKQFYGVRLGMQLAAGSQLLLFANAGMQQGDYAKLNYWFQRKRSDRYYDLTLGANWSYSKHWSLRPQLNYALNESNIELYGFNRLDASLTLRRDFR